ncbi:hypothetical protein BDR07DRAFT_1608985 [Suillus spraguei]|nr:hypothetical protein BDR07DRAFT_1608985 [Suillus spraguei]
MQVEDVRGKEELYKLDNAGFQYGREVPKYTNLLDDDEMEREYYPESIDLIKRVTGAIKVDHSKPGDVPEKHQPVSLAHVDRTPAAAIARVHRHLPPTEAPALLHRTINLWRSISHPSEDWPLALCDFRSVDFEKDLVPVALIYPDRRGMTPEEFVLIKCFDSIQDGSLARLTPHSAFQDPNTPEGAPPRESIELRALVFYD